LKKILVVARSNKIEIWRLKKKKKKKTREPDCSGNI